MYFPYFPVFPSTSRCPGNKHILVNPDLKFWMSKMRVIFAQRMVWVHHLLDDDYICIWKTIELSALRDFFPDLYIVWKSHVPDSVLNKLVNHQVAESMKTLYAFRKHALDTILEISFDEFSAEQYLWFNKQICSRSKQYFLSRLVWKGNLLYFWTSWCSWSQ